MRIKVTGRGIYGGDGELPIGTEFSIAGDIPPGWKDRVEVVKGNPAKDAVAVTAAPVAEPEPKPAAEPERDPLDHDNDGHKGGSLPRPRGRPPKQR